MFVRDTVARRTVLASEGDGGVPSDGQSRPGNISAEGRYVAFESAATTFLPGDESQPRRVAARRLG